MRAAGCVVHINLGGTDSDMVLFLVTRMLSSFNVDIIIAFYLCKRSRYYKSVLS